MSDHDQSVLQQFGSQAKEYLASAVHARGPDLVRAKELVGAALSPRSESLDVGCGAGHLSFALAPHCARMTALDPSAEMLEVVAQEAVARGLAQLQTARGSAGALPFDDASFDLVATRYSAHHWTDISKAVGEFRRTLRPGGYALVIDTLGDANALVDTHLQAIELLRDRSHVRNATEHQWRERLAEHGFAVLETARWPTRLEFDSWVRRMRTSAPRIAAIHALQEDAPEEVRRALVQEPDGSFTIQTGLFWARAPAGGS